MKVTIDEKIYLNQKIDEIQYNPNDFDIIVRPNGHFISGILI